MKYLKIGDIIKIKNNDIAVSGAIVEANYPFFKINTEQELVNIRCNQILGIPETYANLIYDILVLIGGANETDRTSFIWEHCTGRDCDEWRFIGKLGFGGKFWLKKNIVSCYPEDETVERLKIIEKINNLLKNI